MKIKKQQTKLKGCSKGSAKGKCIAIDTYIKKEEMSPINYLNHMLTSRQRRAE